MKPDSPINLQPPATGTAGDDDLPFVVFRITIPTEDAMTPAGNQIARFILAQWIYDHLRQAGVESTRCSLAGELNKCFGCVRTRQQKLAASVVLQVITLAGLAECAEIAYLTDDLACHPFHPPEFDNAL